MRGSSASFFEKNVLASHGSVWLAEADWYATNVQFVLRCRCSTACSILSPPRYLTETLLILTFSIGLSTNPAIRIGWRGSAFSTVTLLMLMSWTRANPGPTALADNGSAGNGEFGLSLVGVVGFTIETVVPPPTGA